MGSKRHLAEPGRRRLLLRLALGLALIYGLRQHLSLRTVAHERLVALQAMSSTTTPLQTPSAARFFAPRAAQPPKETQGIHCSIHCRYKPWLLHYDPT